MDDARMTTRSPVRAPKAPVKKARKSAALIVAEANIAELKEDMAEVKRLLWGIFGSLGSLVVTVAGSAISYFLFK